ncbi:MAG TPA: TIM barrel protein [Methanocellaceae archaeon]|jgi:deoxyribonuclease-4
MIRVGIAGIPRHVKGGGTEAGARYLSEAGLAAMEVQFVRNVYMTPESAKKVSLVGKACDIKFSVHAPYYINLTSKNQDTQEKSKEWILRSLRIANDLGAGIIVCHPAREPDAEQLKEHLLELSQARSDEGLKPLIGLETTGDARQFGSAEDYVDMLKSVPGTDIVIDFCHIHARTNGNLRSRVDYDAIFDSIRSVKTNDFHIHFSGVEYKNSREVRHLPLGNEPDFHPLAQILKERKLNATIICETPLQEDDALRMKEILDSI